MPLLSALITEEGAENAACYVRKEGAGTSLAPSLVSQVSCFIVAKCVLFLGE